VCGALCVSVSASASASVSVNGGKGWVWAGSLAEAADNFERATLEDPGDARAWSYFAQACQHQKRWWARGRQAAAKACQLDPMNATYLKLAGKLFLEADMLGRAGKYYVAAQSWGGDDPEVEQALAELGITGDEAEFRRRIFILYLGWEGKTYPDLTAKRRRVLRDRLVELVTAPTE